MAMIVCEFCSMVMLKDPIHKKYPGGIAAFRKKHKPMAEDKHLLQWGHMGGETLFGDIIQDMERYGICFDEKDPACPYVFGWGGACGAKRHWLAIERIHPLITVLWKKDTPRGIPLSFVDWQENYVIKQLAAQPHLPSTRLINFYLQKGKTTEGYTLDQICHWDDDRLETTHDYIQWLFPIESPSPVNKRAPVFTEQFLYAVKNNETIKNNMTKAMSVYLRSIGIKAEWDWGFTLLPHAEDRIARWCTSASHNHLRITRMLLCLRLAGFYRATNRLFRFLEKTMQEKGFGAVQSIEYWRDAVSLGDTRHWVNDWAR